MSDNNSTTILTPEVKQVSQLLQNGDPRRRFGLYVRAKMFSMFNRNINGQTNNMTKLAEELGPAYDLALEAGLIGGMKLGGIAGNALVRKARLFTPRAATFGTLVPTIAGGFAGSLAAGAAVAALDSRGLIPGALQAPNDDIHRGGAVVGSRVGMLAGLARGLATMGSTGGNLARAGYVLNSVGMGSVLGRAAGSIGGYYVSKAVNESKADDQSEDVDANNQYTGQLNAS